jgi:diaminopimelate epimerase
MRFTKMQGAGNDFIIINNMEEHIPEDKLSKLAERICSRRLSIGADGLMVVTKAENGGDYRMMFFNSDGSAAEMCGNGARCISRYGHDKGLATGDTQRVETVAGIVIGKRVSERLYTVRLNTPSTVRLNENVTVDGNNYAVSYVELGNPGIPHAVVLLDNFDEMPENDLRELGRKLRWYEGFPKGANVSFCKLTGKDSLKAITFERGVEDFTLACGTGCGSMVTALTLSGVVSGNDVKIAMPGGDLSVKLNIEDGKVKDVFLTGPTNVVAEGEVCDEDLVL